MNKNRPIHEVKSLIKDGIFNLSKTEYRFLKLLNQLENPLTNDKIIEFYEENVQTIDCRYYFKEGNWIGIKYTDAQIKMKALSWFDRNLGCMIRKQILSSTGNSVLNELVLTK